MSDFGAAFGGGICEVKTSTLNVPAYGSKSAWTTVNSFNNDVNGIWLSMTHQAYAGQHGTAIMDIAIGSTANIVIADLQLAGDGDAFSQYTNEIYIPIQIPRGTSIYYRGRRSYSGDCWGAYIHIRSQPTSLYNRALVGQFDTYGIDTTNITGVAVNGHATTPQAWGSWSQIAASTTHDSKYLLMAVGTHNSGSRTAATEYRTQIGVGSAGSEQVIMDSEYLRCNHTYDTPSPMFSAYHIDVPAGSSLSIRHRTNATDAVHRMLSYSLYLGR